jgi:hypothetical protein
MSFGTCERLWRVEPDGFRVGIESSAFREKYQDPLGLLRSQLYQKKKKKKKPISPALAISYCLLCFPGLQADVEQHRVDMGYILR